MKYFFALYMTLLLCTTNLFSQEKTIVHKVEKGETITQIAQKYKVTPFDIYQLNPDAQRGISPNSILLIPNKSAVKSPVKQTVTDVKSQSHLVLAKETLYGLEKKYGVSDEDLKRANPFLETEGLQIGQVLIIPSKNAAKKTVVVQDKLVVPFQKRKKSQKKQSKKQQ